MQSEKLFTLDIMEKYFQIFGFILTLVKNPF